MNPIYLLSITITLFGYLVSSQEKYASIVISNPELDSEMENMTDFLYQSDSLSNEELKKVSSYLRDGSSFARDLVQPIVNKAMDISIAEMITVMREDKEGYISIPDIINTFSSGDSFWRPLGEFVALNGSFGDFTTARRIKDVSVKQYGNKYVAYCTFGLCKADLNYGNYKLQYGLAKLNGELQIIFDGLEMLAEISLDYNKRPCKSELHLIRLKDPGNVRVKLNGLGPLNKVTATFASWLSKNWKSVIFLRVEEKISRVVTKYLDQYFNCDKLYHFDGITSKPQSSAQTVTSTAPSTVAVDNKPAS